MDVFRLRSRQTVVRYYFVLDVCLEASRSQYLEIFYSLPLHENHSCELSETTFRPFLTMPLIVTTKTSLYTKYNFAVGGVTMFQLFRVGHGEQVKLSLQAAFSSSYSQN